MQALSPYILVVFSIAVWTGCNAETEQKKENNQIAAFGPCKDDVSRLCANRALPNDLAVLDCLQDSRSESDSDINPQCHSVSLKFIFFAFEFPPVASIERELSLGRFQFLWQFKLNLTKGDQFLDAAEKLCKAELKELDDCKLQSQVGHKLSCLLENADAVAPGLLFIIHRF